MALTRAQLLMGNISDGVVLTGQPQGVRPGGAGISIGTDGTISIDSQTVIGIMKLGQTPVAAAAAYNGYNWPAATGSLGQQLEIVSLSGGLTTLAWADADGIDWTAKGQLIVGTGVGTDTLLDSGTNLSILVADPTTASGLNYTSNLLTAMLAPVGSTVQRPGTPQAGMIRFNNNTGKFEYYDGTIWQEIASGDPVPGGFTFVKQSIPTDPATETGNALIPAGTTAQRQTAPAPVVGSMRYNTGFNQIELWNGTSWQQIASDASYDFVLQTRPPAGKTASAVIPSGTTAQREAAGAVGGWFRYNTDLNELEFYNGTDWDLIAPSGGAVSSFVQAATPTARNVGDLWYNTTLQREAVWDGGAWALPGMTQTSPTGAGQLPVGTTAQRPAGAAGYIRYNTSISTVEFYDATNATWTPGSGFAAGTRMIFVQAAAPIGWVKETGAAYNDAALRFVTGGTGNSTGGSTGFTTTFASYTPVGTIAGTNANATQGGTVASTAANATAGGSVAGTTSSVVVAGSVTGSVSATALTTAQMPSHSHVACDVRGSGFAGFVIDNGGGGVQAIPGGVGGNTCYTVPTGVTAEGGGGTHTHSLTSATLTTTTHDHTFSSALTGTPHTHTVTSTYTGAAHTHTFTGTFTGTASSQFAVKYVDTIICTKS